MAGIASGDALVMSVLFLAGAAEASVNRAPVIVVDPRPGKMLGFDLLKHCLPFAATVRRSERLERAHHLGRAIGQTVAIGIDKIDCSPDSSIPIKLFGEAQRGRGR